MKILLFYKKYLINFRSSLSILIMINIFSLLTNLYLTYFTGIYVDLLTSISSIDWILKFTLLILFIGILNILFKTFITYFFAKTQTNIVFKLNASLLEHVKKLPLSFFKDMDIVYLNQRINADTNVMVNFIITILVNLIIQIISFLFISFFLFKMNLVIAIIVLLSIPLYIFLYLKFRKKLYETSYESKEQQGIFFSHMHDQLANIKFTKINVLFEKLDNTLIEKFPALLNSLLKNIKYNSFFSSTKSIIENFFNIFLFFYGGIQIYNNQMTIGNFLIIKSYYSLLLNTIASFVEIVKQYPDTLVSHNRIANIFNLQSEYNGNKIINTIDSIKLNKVYFSYDQQHVLKEFSYTFQKGKVYLINGGNGTGKSTLIDVMLGLHMGTYMGGIYYNNIDINELDLYYLRKNLISVLEQEPLLTYFSICENLSELDKLDDTNAQSITHWINELKINDLANKIENVNISEVLVSGGEKQKIALARTLTKNADVILLDEPTSALDNHSIKLFKNIIEKIKVNKIIIIISHDNKLKPIADNIIEM